MIITQPLVELAYRLFLGRYPESPEVITDKMARLRTLEDLRYEFLNAPEFLQQIYPKFLRMGYLEAPAEHFTPLEVSAPPDDLEQLYARIREQWTTLGDTEPYWSVLTDERFKKERIINHIDDFNQSGRQVIGLLEAQVQRNDVTLPRGHCFELGCGTGRITRHLAGLFQEVTAADISSGHLHICANYLEEQEVYNVRTLLLPTPALFEAIAPFDVFISFIVLQYNPPPVQFYMLDQILSRVSDGGLALFQLSVYRNNYRFEIRDYLSRTTQTMEMHCLPMRYVMQLFRKYGFSILELHRDNWSGLDHHSYTFFAQRVRGES